MASILIQTYVRDTAGWRKVFDQGEGLRKSKGMLSQQVFSDAFDPNKLTILFKWSSLAEAQKFASSPELHAALEKSGVEGTPVFAFLEEV